MKKDIAILSAIALVGLTAVMGIVTHSMFAVIPESIGYLS